MSTETSKIETWPDLAIGLYDRLTERNAEISYNFEDFSLEVPQKVGSERKTEWKMNGKLTITTAEKSS
ncbi:hypothetical protein [Lewinella cohaerens]|uniref:hypothetical protein n=1 Tax=Lewinella cohaerens TaxID=70995 RepID=UPI00036B9C29|nr:hypothetical protein [Lewinella cohaerens]